MTIKAVIQFEHDDPTGKAPWPVGLDENLTVTSGLGPDDGATLLGFGPKGEQHIDVWAEDAIANPESVKGLTPSFARAGGMFEWLLQVKELEVR